MLQREAQQNVRRREGAGSGRFERGSKIGRELEKLAQWE